MRQRHAVGLVLRHTVGLVLRHAVWLVLRHAVGLVMRLAIGLVMRLAVGLVMRSSMLCRFVANDDFLVDDMTVFLFKRLNSNFTSIRDHLM